MSGIGMMARRLAAVVILACVAGAACAEDAPLLAAIFGDHF